MLLLRIIRSSVRLQALSLGRHAGLFHSSHLAAAAPLPPRLKLKEDDIQEAFIHGTGPGGQKINKTACAVQLKHLPTGITTKCQETRSRPQNRKIARRILAEKVEDHLKGPESRSAVKAQVKSRKKASKAKKARRKHRAAQEGEEDEDGDKGGREEAEEEVDPMEKQELKAERL